MVYQIASFSIGYGSTCPPLDTLIIEVKNNTITFSVFYDIRGGWPLVGCSRLDTLHNLVANGNYSIIVNTNIIGNDSIGAVDTVFFADTDTTYNVIVSIESLLYKISSLKIFPNPVKDYIKIKYPPNLIVYSISLHDITGRKIITNKNSNNQIILGNISKGIYLIVIHTNKGVFHRKIITE